MKKLLVCILILVINFIPATNVNAENDCNVYMKLSEEKIMPGEDLVANLFVKANVSINIAAFRIKVYYDNSKIEFKGVEPGINTDSSEFKYYDKNNLLTLLYLESTGGVNLESGDEFKFVGFKFKVLDDSELGSTKLDIDLDDMINYDLKQISKNKINPISFEIFVPEPSKCRLSNLEVSSGMLVPNFDPSITDYKLSVPYEDKSVEVYATPENDTDTVKVNRKTLGGAGSNTDVKVTVTSSDGKNKLIYKINVYRGLKESSVQSSESSKKNSSTSSKSGVSKNSSENSSKKNLSSSSSGSSSKSASKTSDGIKSVSSGSTYATSESYSDNGEENSILLKKDEFRPFIFGIILSGIACVVIYFVYKKKFKINKDKK